MILFCNTNRDLEVWYLDLAGSLARPPIMPAVYALCSFEAEAVRYYVGSTRRFTARMSAHLSFARSEKLRGHSAGGRFLEPVVANRRRLLVIILETCPSAATTALQRCEQAWLLSAARDCGEAALAYQVPATTAPLRGPHAPATLAARRHWPLDSVEALKEFFREPRRGEPLSLALSRAINAKRKPQSAKPAHPAPEGETRQ